MRSLSRRWRAPLLAMLIALGAVAPASADALTASIDESATLSPGHQAVILTGTLECAPGGTWNIQGRVVQGRASGFGSAFMQPCMSDPQEWSLVVISGSSLFHRGRASAGITANVCDFTGCDFAQLDRFVTVR